MEGNITDRKEKKSGTKEVSINFISFPFKSPKKRANARMDNPNFPNIEVFHIRIQ